MLNIVSFRALIVAAAVLTLLLAAARIGPETRALSEAGQDQAFIVLRAASSEPSLTEAGAVLTQVRQLSDCDDLLASSYVRVSGQQTVENLSRACARNAKAALNSSPTLSIAHLVQARAAFNLKDFERAGVHFEASYQTARIEGWLAARRVRLLFDAGLTGTLRVPEETAYSDVLTVLADNRYHSLLAQLYIRFPQHQEWLQGALQKGSAQHQRRLTAHVKSLLQD